MRKEKRRRARVYEMRQGLLTIVVMIVSGVGVVAIMLWLWMLYAVGYEGRHAGRGRAAAAGSLPGTASTGIPVTSVAKRWAMSHLWHDSGRASRCSVSSAPNRRT